MDNLVVEAWRFVRKWPQGCGRNAALLLILIAVQPSAAPRAFPVDAVIDCLALTLG